MKTHPKTNVLKITRLLKITCLKITLIEKHFVEKHFFALSQKHFFLASFSLKNIKTQIVKEWWIRILLNRSKWSRPCEVSYLTTKSEEKRRKTKKCKKVQPGGSRAPDLQPWGRECCLEARAAFVMCDCENLWPYSAALALKLKLKNPSTVGFEPWTGRVWVCAESAKAEWVGSSHST